MPSATWEGLVLAQRELCGVWEGSGDFPADPVKRVRLGGRERTSL